LRTTLLRAIPRRGYMVTPITLKDIHDVFELRLMLEPRLARMAPQGGCSSTSNPRRSLSTRLPVGRHQKYYARFLEANKSLHVAIAQATAMAARPAWWRNYSNR